MYRNMDVVVQKSRPTVDYYTLNLELDCVHWVDDAETLTNCLQHVTMVTKALHLKELHLIDIDPLFER